MRFKRLSHVFVIRSNDPAMVAYISRVLDRFAVRGSIDEAVSYEIRDLGPSAPYSRYRLLIDGDWVNGSGNPSHVLDDLFSHVNIDTVTQRAISRARPRRRGCDAPEAWGSCYRHRRGRGRRRSSQASSVRGSDTSRMRLPCWTQKGGPCIPIRCTSR